MHEKSANFTVLLILQKAHDIARYRAVGSTKSCRPTSSICCFALRKSKLKSKVQFHCLFDTAKVHDIARYRAVGSTKSCRPTSSICCFALRKSKLKSTISLSFWYCKSARHRAMSCALQYQKDSGIVFFNLHFVRQTKQLELVGLQLFIVMPTARYRAMSRVSQKYNALVATASGLFHLEGCFAAAELCDCIMHRKEEAMRAVVGWLWLILKTWQWASCPTCARPRPVCHMQPCTGALHLCAPIQDFSARSWEKVYCMYQKDRYIHHHTPTYLHTFVNIDFFWCVGVRM